MHSLTRCSNLQWLLIGAHLRKDSIYEYRIRCAPFKSSGSKRSKKRDCFPAQCSSSLISRMSPNDQVHSRQQGVSLTLPESRGHDRVVGVFLSSVTRVSSQTPVDDATEERFQRAVFVPLESALAKGGCTMTCGCPFC
mmetsp:Transcript_56453/g.151008  ORF Transcript_56453/g.151008 Transcript_56453/m.151008 type:complete len:138 (-) Transcript_56453:77-490(-)